MAAPRASLNNARHHGSAPKRPPKPGPNYVWNGMRWVKKPAAPKAPTRTTTRTTTSWAEEQAQRIVDEQLAAIQAQQSAWQQGLQDEAKRRAEQARAFAQMVQGMGIDKTIQGIYSNAGHDVAGYGAGFSGEFREQADKSAAETINMLGGDATGVRNEGDGIANVIHGLGGYIPSAELAAHGAAFASDAAMQPGFMLQQGLMEAERGLAEGMADNPFLDAILQTKLGKHDLVRSLKEERTEMNFKAQEMRLKQIENDRDYWLKMQALYLSQKKYKLAAAAEKRARSAETRYANETAGRDAYGDVSPDYYEDAQGRVVPKGYKYNAKGILVKTSTAGSSKDKRGGSLTVNEQQRQLENVYKAEDDIMALAAKLAKEYRWPPSVYDRIGDSVSEATGGRRPATTKAIRNKIAAQIRQRYGWVTTTASKKALAQIIGRVLSELAKGPPSPGGDTATSGSGLFD